MPGEVFHRWDNDSRIFQRFNAGFLRTRVMSLHGSNPGNTNDTRIFRPQPYSEPSCSGMLVNSRHQALRLGPSLWLKTTSGAKCLSEILATEGNNYYKKPTSIYTRQGRLENVNAYQIKLKPDNINKQG